MDIKLCIFLCAVVVTLYAVLNGPTQPTSVTGYGCLSWRLAVETNNIRGWSLVPQQCSAYVGNYMQSKQYHEDCNAVVDAAISFSKSLDPANDSKDVWVFDIDETALSNLPFYAKPDVAFGAKPRNWTKLDEWFKSSEAPALPASLRLYEALVAKGFKVVFITGIGEMYRAYRESNLKKAGYTSWVKLILKSEAERGTSSVVFKSKKRKELEDSGYKIIGNIGDQWSDLIGTNIGKRTFKLPNPMYYVG